MNVYLDGKWVAREDAMVSVWDHGLLYGDGIFEGIRAYNGTPFRLSAHLERFEASAKALMLEGLPRVSELASKIEEGIRRETEGGNANVYIRLVATRGVGPLGLDPFTCPKPGLFAIFDTIKLYPQQYYDEGVPLVIAGTRRMAPDALDPRIKSLNYLNNILAKIQARQAGAMEAVLLNGTGHVAECTGDNVIVAKGGELLVPESHYGALEGITLGAVLDLAAKEHVPVRKTGLTPFDLYTADEIFLTGTAAEIIPVRSIDGRQLQSCPGPMFTRLWRSFQHALVEDRAWVLGSVA